MSGSKLFDLANIKAWPALIEHLGNLGVDDINEQLLYVERYVGRCASMMAAYRNAPAPVWKALIEAALRAGLDLRAILTRANAFGKFTVLHLAAGDSEDEVACCLAFLCPSALDMKDGNNQTPLEVAKARNRPSSSVIAALTQAVNDRAGFLKQQLEVRGGGHRPQTHRLRLLVRLD